LPELELRDVTFTGSLTFDSEGVLHRDRKDGELQWVGDPTPEMDSLWERVGLNGKSAARFKETESSLKTREPAANVESIASGIYLDGWEADDVRGKSKYIDGYWISGLDFLHQMHCLVSVWCCCYMICFVGVLTSTVPSESGSESTIPRLLH
jgi:hypothetical protein